MQKTPPCMFVRVEISKKQTFVDNNLVNRTEFHAKVYDHADTLLADCIHTNNVVAVKAATQAAIAVFNAKWGR